MIEEKTFNDIRRNYILSSVIFILFLIYWWKVEINKILLFDLSWEWYYFSPFIDIFILLLIFFLYTFIRYIIYGFEFINNNKYKYLVLYTILDNVIIKAGQSFIWNKYIKSWKLLKLQEWALNKEWQIKILQVNSNQNRRTLNMTIFYKNFIFDDWNQKDKQDTWSIPNFYNIFDLNILNNKIDFKFKELSISWIDKVEIEFNSQNIIKEFWPKFYNIIFKKEYSDFVWPLSLSLIIYFILIVKIISYVYN